MFIIVGLIVILYIAYLLYQHFFPSPNIDPRGKYVLISGCDTGVGHALAIALDKQGFNVFAGVYNLDNEVTLQVLLSSRATVFHLDITRQEDIDAAYDLIIKKTTILHALINNAGITWSGYIDWITIESMRKTIDVNFFGHAAMTKKFLSLLIGKRDSRVVNISSMCGYISLPGSSAYCVSKYALESFSDCLRREMAPWGLRVSVIEPGPMHTPMTEGLEQSLRSVWSNVPVDIQERWGGKFFDDGIQQTLSSPLIRYPENPNKTVRAVEHAIMNTVPRIRYRPGWQSSAFFFPLSMLPDWLVDKLLASSARSLPAGVCNQLKN